MTLGYAWQGHPADTTLELPDKIARRLLHDGKARRADDEVAAELDAAEESVAVPEPVEPPGPEAFLRAMKTGELHAYAAANGITIPAGVATRRDLIAAVAAGVKSNAPTIEGMTVDQLRAYAAAHDIDIPKTLRKRVDIIEHIAAVEQETRVHSPEDPPAPDGDKHEEA